MRQAALDPRARRIVLAAAGTATALVMLLGYRTSTPGSVPTTVVAAGTAVAGTTVTGDVATGASTTGDVRTPSAPATTTPSAPATTTATGGAVATQYGPVQVQITVTDGVITEADAVQAPDGSSRDVQINSRAVPLLNQETIDAQSAGIDTVSGATYTSDGYAASLQSAIDAAGL